MWRGGAGEPGAPITPCPCRSHFSLEVKLNSSSGLLFYVAGERGSSMALFVSNGRFVFLVEVGRRRLRIRSKDKYRDGRWHTVSGLSGTSLNHIRAPEGLAQCSPALGVASRLHMGRCSSRGAKGTAKSQPGLAGPLSGGLPSLGTALGLLPTQESPSLGTELCSLQVFFSRDQSRAQLVIDGLRAQGAAVATTGLFVAQTPLYVGGLPAGKAKAHIPVRAWRPHGITLSEPVPSPVASPCASQLLPPLCSVASLHRLHRPPALMAA